MKSMKIAYMYIPPEDYNTPLMYIPMQRAVLDVEEPCGAPQIKQALARELPGFFPNLSDLHIERSWEVKS